jgi:hypothetical protein
MFDVERLMFDVHLFTYYSYWEILSLTAMETVTRHTVQVVTGQ